MNRPWLTSNELWLRLYRDELHKRYVGETYRWFNMRTKETTMRKEEKRDSAGAMASVEFTPEGGSGGEKVDAIVLFTGFESFRMTLAPREALKKLRSALKLAEEILEEHDAAAKKREDQTHLRRGRAIMRLADDQRAKTLYSRLSTGASEITDEEAIQLGRYAAEWKP